MDDCILRLIPLDPFETIPDKRLRVDNLLTKSLLEKSTEKPKLDKLFDGGLIIGRKSALTAHQPHNGEFASPIISRSHAQLAISPDGQIYVSDLGSLHGTSILSDASAGHTECIRLVPRSPIQLCHDDTLILGKSVISGRADHKPLRLLVKFQYPELGKRSSDGTRIRLRKTTPFSANDTFASFVDRPRLLAIFQNLATRQSAAGVQQYNPRAFTSPLTRNPESRARSVAIHQQRSDDHIRAASDSMPDPYKPIARNEYPTSMSVLAVQDEGENLPRGVIDKLKYDADVDVRVEDVQSDRSRSSSIDSMPEIPCLQPSDRIPQMQPLDSPRALQRSRAVSSERPRTSRYRAPATDHEDSPEVEIEKPETAKEDDWPPSKVATDDMAESAMEDLTESIPSPFYVSNLPTDDHRDGQSASEAHMENRSRLEELASARASDQRFPRSTSIPHVAPSEAPPQYYSDAPVKEPNSDPNLSLRSPLTSSMLHDQSSWASKLREVREEITVSLSKSRAHLDSLARNSIIKEEHLARSVMTEDPQPLLSGGTGSPSLAEIPLPSRGPCNNDISSSGRISVNHLTEFFRDVPKAADHQYKRDVASDQAPVRGQSGSQHSTGRNDIPASVQKADEPLDEKVPAYDEADDDGSSHCSDASDEFPNHQVPGYDEAQDDDQSAASYADSYGCVDHEPVYDWERSEGEDDDGSDEMESNGSGNDDDQADSPSLESDGTDVLQNDAVESDVVSAKAASEDGVDVVKQASAVRQEMECCTRSDPVNTDRFEEAKLKEENIISEENVGESPTEEAAVSPLASVNMYSMSLESEMTFSERPSFPLQMDTRDISRQSEPELVRPRTPSISEASSNGPITPPSSKKRALPTDFESGSERPVKSPRKDGNRGFVRGMGLVVLGAALGSVGTIAGLMQLAD